MDVQILSLCDSASITSGKMNLIGVYDHFQSPSLPVSLQMGTIALRVKFDEVEFGEKEITIAIVDPDGRPAVNPVTQILNVTAENVAMMVIQMVIPITNLPLVRFGEHAIQLCVNGRMERETSFYFNPTPPASEPRPATSNT